MTSATPLTDRTIGSYLDTLGSATPTPGGGSVSGVAGALAAGLGQMVASVTGKSGEDPVYAEQVATLQAIRERFTSGAEGDEIAYGGYIEASRLPKSTAEEKAARREALQVALERAARAPLAIAVTGADLLEVLTGVIAHGGGHILSDAEIGVLLGEVAVTGALINVRANLPYLKDAALVTELTEAIAATEGRAREAAQAARNLLTQRRA